MILLIDIKTKSNPVALLCAVVTLDDGVTSYNQPAPITIQTTSTTAVTVAGSSSSLGSSGDGLGQSDRIALGVGLGVGIPATIAALITCYLQIRRRQ